MNKDVDERLVPNGEYIDALNVRVLSSSGSDAGAVENERGNEKITFVSEANNPVTIGSIADEANEKIYWFTVNDSGHSFIYEYDAKNEVTSVVLADTRSSNVLAFDKNYKITGVNIVYNIHNDKNLLLFTDGLNAPRCINIERAKSYGENGFNEDDISLYKKPPRRAPEITPYNTPNVSENSVKERYFAFAYRYKYQDGEYSALSSFTNYQFVPGDFDLDLDTMENHGMVNLFNAYNITYNTGDKRVTDIQLCFKTTDSEVVYIIDTINKSENAIINDTERTFSFTNNKVYAALASDEIGRLFDAIPLTAKAQEFIENRIVYGNITEQYDLLHFETMKPLEIDYEAEHIVKSRDGEAVSYTIQNYSQDLVIDFTGVTFTKGHLIYLSIRLESDSVTDGSNTYYGGSFDGNVAVTLSENYTNIPDFLASSDWDELLGQMNISFANSVETTPHPNETNIAYGDFAIAFSTQTSFSLSAPVITYTTSGGDEVEQFTWIDTTAVSVRELDVFRSLKSNSGYEIGVVYMDAYGRYSSVLPPSDPVGGKKNDIFVPAINSVDVNRAQVTINNFPPYWADRYKFFIKSNKSSYSTIHSSLFYEDGVYRWVLLTGSDYQKVEPGMNLVVKSDGDGPLTSEVKVKVLDVQTKTFQDVNSSNSTTAEEGWIEGNEGPDGETIKEVYGTFMKIKPVGFKMNYSPNSIFTYDSSELLTTSQSGNATTYLPDLDEMFDSGTITGTIINKDKGGILQYLDGAGAYVNASIKKNTRIDLNFSAFENDGQERHDYIRRFYAKNEYVGDANECALEKFLASGETSWAKPSGEDYYTTSQDLFRIRFFRIDLTSEGYGYKHYMFVQTTEDSDFADTANISASIQVYINGGAQYVFETDALGVDDDIYYETEQTFDIVGFRHQGNVQNQTNSNPAICELNVGNCFSFGNGVESIQIRDEKLGAIYDFKTRPNIVLLDGYKKRKLDTTLIYSGPKNITTSYNNLNEFNASRGITKVLDMKFGSIQRLLSRDSDLIAFQEDKVQKVLYGKSLIQGADGSGSLSTIDAVFGREVPFAGDFGISKNPESLVTYGGRVYFTDANRGMALRLGGDGITPISFYGMDGYFKDNLFQYKNSFNVGGFDPDNNEYVLSINQSAKPTETPRVPCSTSIVKKVGSGETYEYVVDMTGEGDVTVSYDITGNADITLDVQSSNTTNTDLSGTGTLSVTLFPGDDELTITIAANEDTYITIDASCPVYQERTIDLAVVNDATLAGDTILTSYQIASGTEYGNATLVLDADEVTKEESYVAKVDSNQAPADGDTVTMKVSRIYGLHSGEFTANSSMGYLITSATKTTSEVIAEATYVSATYTKLQDRDVHSISFTFNETTPDDRLYMVWSFEP